MIAILLFFSFLSANFSSNCITTVSNCNLNGLPHSPSYFPDVYILLRDVSPQQFSTYLSNCLYRESRYTKLGYCCSWFTKSVERWILNWALPLGLGPKLEKTSLLSMWLVGLWIMLSFVKNLSCSNWYQPFV